MLAFTFPGQGSQRPGMGRPWAGEESWELVGEASEIAERDLGRLLLEGDADELKDTRNAQLCTFVSSLVVLDAIERTGLDAMFCAGHSLGEYTALVATGALSFDEGVQLVAERAEAMHAAGQDQPGTMSAVLGLDDDEVEIACRRADSDVWVANFNAPGQVVIAGSPEGVASAAAHAKELGAKKVMPLPVSGAFHTPFMAPARDRLRKAIAEAKPRDTDVPVISNVDALAHDKGDDWASLLSAQLCSPVRWRQCLLSARRCRRHDARRARAGRRADGHGEAHDPERHRDLGEHAGRSRLAARAHREQQLPRPISAGTRASTCSRPSAWSSAPLPVCSRLIRRSPPATSSRRAHLVGRVGDHEVRSPFGGIGHGPHRRRR